MIDPNKIADLVKKTLKGSGYKVKMYTDEGDSTLDPRVARRFFTIPDQIMITLDESDNLIKFHKSDSVSINDIRDLHKSIKNLASKYNMDFVMREFGKEIEPKNYVSDSIKVINDNEDNASEIKEALSKLAGTHLKSNQTLDNSTKIIIKHSKSIDEEVKGSRSRHIDTIYVENTQGERFKYPFKNMSGARAMARHIHEGGTPYDNVGKSIISISEDNMKLSKFLRYSRNNGLNEANQDTIDAVSKRVDSNKRFLHTLSNANTYEATVNSIEDKIEEQQELDVTGLKDAFTKRVFDENIEEVLPMVQKIIDEASVAEAKKDPYAGMSMLDRAKSAELGPDISGEYSSKNIKRFANKQAEIVYKVTELNMRVMDDELNRVVTNALGKLEDGKSVSREDIDIIKALIARGKELGAYQESVKADVVPEEEVAEWTEQVAGDKALFSEDDVEEAATPVDDDDPRYADDENLPKNKKKSKMSKADKNWLDAQNSMLDHEGKYNPRFNEGRMGFKDLDKLGAENASKVDQECRRRGSADMEPGDADQLRYKVAKEMGLVEDTVKEEAFDKVDRITDPEELNLYDEEDIKAANNMSAEELKDELKGDIYHLMDMAADDFTDNDHIADEMGDYFANMHMKGDDASLSCYAAMRDLIDADPADVYETGAKCLKILGAQEHTKESAEYDIATIRARAGLPEVTETKSDEDDIEDTDGEVPMLDTEFDDEEETDESTSEEETPIEEDAGNKKIEVNKDIKLAMDSIWERDEENMTQMVYVKNITINNPHAPGGYMDDEPDDGYRSVNVEHDGPWTIYTDTGFEKAISDLVGFEVGFTEQGMQEDGMASMEGDDPKMAKEAVDRDLALIKSRAGM